MLQQNNLFYKISFLSAEKIKNKIEFRISKLLNASGDLLVHSNIVLGKFQADSHRPFKNKAGHALN